jgi:hypothetical protein
LFKSLLQCLTDLRCLWVLRCLELLFLVPVAEYFSTNRSSRALFQRLFRERKKLTNFLFLLRIFVRILLARASIVLLLQII